MSKKSFIDRVRVDDPCTQDWETMRGNDKVRFCDHCSTNVNNISAMTRKEALKLVRRSGGNLCIRYREDPNTGTRMFAPHIAKLARRTGAAAGVLGASLLLANPVFTQGGAQVVQIARLAKTSGGGSSISGTVTDPNGAVIPFAIVSLTNQETSEYFIQNASEDGKYLFKDLTAGKYKLKIDAGGFQSKELTDIEVQDGIESARNTQLEIQKVDATVDVPIDGEVHQFVTMGVVVGEYRDEKSNPLVQAVLNDDLDTVKELLQRKPKVNVRDKSENGISPLHAAVENGNLEMAALLLSYGAKVNARDNDKRTPLMMIDYDAEPEMLDLLLTYGARFDLKDKEKNNVLHYAAKNSVEDEVFKRLLILGLDLNAVNKQGETALMLASENENESIVEMLLRAGAYADLKDKERRTAIERTENQSIKATLALFLQNGAPGK